MNRLCFCFVLLCFCGGGGGSFRGWSCVFVSFWGGVLGVCFDSLFVLVFCLYVCLYVVFFLIISLPENY